MSDLPKFINHPWEGRALTSEEIELETKFCNEIVTEMRKEFGRIASVRARVLNHYYVKALKKGETVNEARTAAYWGSGFWVGCGFGGVAVAFALGVGGYFYHLSTILNGVNTFFAVLIWCMIFALGFKKIRRPVGRFLLPERCRIAYRNTWAWIKTKSRRTKEAKA